MAPTLAPIVRPRRSEASRRARAVRGRLARRGLVLLAAALLVLAACGDPEVVIDDVDEAAPGGEPEDETPEPPEDPEGTESDEGEPDEGEDPGPSEHRPPAEAEALADCEAIDVLDPGAFLAFPSDEDPAWLDAGDGPVTVEFIGCSNTFEANLEYEAYHGDDGAPVLVGATMGGAYGDWARFSFEETFAEAGDWTVVVFETDAASGERREYDAVTFTVG